MSEARILIVDDEPQIRRVLRTTLVSQGYTVAEAKGGDEALEQVREERPDLILLDVNMPGRSGLEVCQEIRRTSDIPIIVVTGIEPPPVMPHAIMVLSKSCQPDQIAQLVANHLALRNR